MVTKPYPAYTSTLYGLILAKNHMVTKPTSCEVFP